MRGEQPVSVHVLAVYQSMGSVPLLTGRGRTHSHKCWQLTSHGAKALECLLKMLTGLLKGKKKTIARSGDGKGPEIVN